jgi:hypothetical protein
VLALSFHLESSRLCEPFPSIAKMATNPFTSQFSDDYFGVVVWPRQEPTTGSDEHVSVPVWSPVTPPTASLAMPPEPTPPWRLPQAEPVQAGIERIREMLRSTACTCQNRGTCPSCSVSIGAWDAPQPSTSQPASSWDAPQPSTSQPVFPSWDAPPWRAPQPSQLQGSSSVPVSSASSTGQAAHSQPDDDELWQQAMETATERQEFLESHRRAGDSGGMRAQEVLRTGVNGGVVRAGNNGGMNRDYYRGYYSAKGKGKDVLKAYVWKHGGPPSHGGKAFHKSTRVP